MPSQVQAQSHVRPSREVETAAASWHSPPSSTNCYTISSPSETDFHFNTVIIQRALNHHSCVSIVPNPESGRGDYRIQSLFLPSHTLLHLDQGVRLIAVIGETQRALVHILNATNVTLQGLGVLYGSAEDAIDYYDEYDNRFQPRWEDGDPLRPTNLWVTNSDRITVQGISIHNCSYWNFRMDNSSHIFVDSIDIYGDSRFPNNDGKFWRLCCTTVCFILTYTYILNCVLTADHRLHLLSTTQDSTPNRLAMLPSSIVVSM